MKSRPLLLVGILALACHLFSNPVTNAMEFINAEDSTSEQQFNQEMNAFKPDMEVFATKDRRHYIAWAKIALEQQRTPEPVMLSNPFFMSDDGSTFQELHGTPSGSGFSRNYRTDLTVTFDNGSSQNTSEDAGIIIQGKLPTYLLRSRCKGKSSIYTQLSHLEASSILNRAKFLPLPLEPRIILFLYQIKGTSQFIYGDRPVSHTLKLMRLFVGSREKMSEKKVASFVTTGNGEIGVRTEGGDNLSCLLEPGFPDSTNSDRFLPSQGISALWNKQPIELLNPKTFDLKSLGIPGVPSNPSQAKNPCD